MRTTNRNDVTEVRMKRGMGSPNYSTDRQREIARLGGHAAHAAKTGAHEWTSEEAVRAGQKGGRISQDRRALAKVAW